MFSGPPAKAQLSALSWDFRIPKKPHMNTLAKVKKKKEEGTLQHPSGDGDSFQ
jgi:hypothetical protein